MNIITSSLAPQILKVVYTPLLQSLIRLYGHADISHQLRLGSLNGYIAHGRLVQGELDMRLEFLERTNPTQPYCPPPRPPFYESKKCENLQLQHIMNK